MGETSRRVVAAGSAGMVAGYLADAVFGDPRRGHPVAVFGRGAAALDRAMWSDSRVRGAGYAGICVAGAVSCGALAERATGTRPAARFAVTTAVTWAVVGMRGLGVEGLAMRDLLAAEDLPGARARLAHLCGRDAGALDASALTRAACESVAENTSDAVVAPLLWGALAGIPGLLGYRALNTLDAMVGHRGPRYARFGWAAARGDDLANLLPARLSAALTVAAAPALGGSPARALRTWRRDAGGHPSPNAGRVEAAFAGALGVRLGGRDSYQDVVRDRPEMGDGEFPVPADLTRSVRLARSVGALALAAAVLVRQVFTELPQFPPGRA